MLFAARTCTMGLLFSRLYELFQGFSFSPDCPARILMVGLDAAGIYRFAFCLKSAAISMTPDADNTNLRTLHLQNYPRNARWKKITEQETILHVVSALLPFLRLFHLVRLWFCRKVSVFSDSKLLQARPRYCTK